ncbi:hypothetical protein Glove_272g31 [Diversispora epigaea]|uniref:Uncharacterized protein n=1 Tax=Diversispora epigaea TaxID=1348612 RepID=A0A397I5B7_9GLOM|nr:hypothetical protein Glove_272g31 [Diversispora epigaea]
MSGARVLTFEKHIAYFEYFLKLVNLPNSVLYNAQCLNEKEIKEGYKGELVDSIRN